MLPRPPIPETDHVAPDDTFIGRQRGQRRRFPVSLLLTFFKGDKGDKGDSIKGDPGPRGPGTIYDLGAVTIGQKATVILNSGIRKLPIACPGVKVGDILVLTITKAFPSADYLVGLPIVTAADKFDLPVFAPTLIIGAEYSVTGRVFALRLV